MVGAISLDIILVHETMGKIYQVENVLEYLLQGWSFEAVDTNGRSGELALGCRSKNCRCNNMWILDSGLGLEIYAE